MPVLAQEAANVLVAAIVKDLRDPEGLGRIRVTYPHLGETVSEYARLVSPMAGAERGIFFRPQPGDEVLVGFELGDSRRPYIIGSVWSTEDRPPSGANDQPEENNLRFIRSRSGHIFRFDDTPGQERMELIDKDGQRRVAIDSAGSEITIECDTGDINISALTGSVTIAAETITINATGTLTLKGATVAIN
jgi:uncharacterized protein involved in type VI secretion and phage assembly